MNGQVSLPVAIQIQFAYCNRALDGALKIAVLTRCRFHTTSCGIPTLTDTTSISAIVPLSPCQLAKNRQNLLARDSRRVKLCAGESQVSRKARTVAPGLNLAALLHDACVVRILVITLTFHQRRCFVTPMPTFAAIDIGSNSVRLRFRV